MNTPDYAQEDLSVSKEMRRGREPSDDSSSASPSFAASRARAAVAAASSLSNSATRFSSGSTNAALLSTAKMRAWMFASSKSMPDDSSSLMGSGDDDSASDPSDSDRDRLRWYSCKVEPKLADMRSSSSSSLLDSDAGAVRAKATNDDAAVASTLTGRDELREEGAFVVPEAVRFLRR